MSPATPEAIDCSGAAMADDAAPAPPVDVGANEQESKHGTSNTFGGTRKFLTPSNLFYLYMLWGMLPSFGGKKAGAASQATMSAKMPTFQQHFLWEPVGYTPTVSISPAPKPKTNDKGAVTANNVYRGYYTKDKVAMVAALRSIPVRPTIPEHKQSESGISSKACQSMSTATPNGSLGTEEFDDEPVTCSEETIDKTEPRVQKASLRSALSSSVIVLDLKLSANPTKEISLMRSAVAFLLGTVRESRGGRLEVLVRLETNGGSVHHYGLVAEQFRRLRQEPNVTLTVACDLACLSGGYLVASVATPGQLLSSPFAAVGSIGVVSSANALDLREVMESNGIREVRVKSGERKPAAGFLGGMTDEELRYAQERADATHGVFRNHVQRWRGDAIRDIDFASSGDHWLGVDARDHGLVDRLITSDEYIDIKIGEGFSVIRMTGYAPQKTGFLGGEAGEKSWFWIIFDWLFPAEAGDDHQMSVRRDDPSLSIVIRLLRNLLSSNSL